MINTKIIERVSRQKIINNQKQNEKGITLTVLVITIAVILILAGVSITAIFDDAGVINQSKKIQEKTNQTMQNMLAEVNELENKLKERMNIESGGSGGNTENPDDPTPIERTKITDSSLTSDDRTTNSETVIAEDTKGNQVVLPGGFKIASDSGETVQQGVVIEDKEGNQFVWVPVSNINNDGSNKIIKDDGSKVEITLGRYTFATSSPGTPTLVQKGSEYAEVTAANVADGTVNTKYKIGSYYYELSDSRTSNEKGDTTGTNTTAKDLEAFITKTNTNKGFYIARYEASYGSGYNSSGTTTEKKYGNAKPLSKISNANSTTKMTYTAGTLWNFITQPEAAMVSKNMYSGNNYIESDLINSYAWDTAIVYIQEMGNTNYANQSYKNGMLKDTGEVGDQACKIFDMAANAYEWTTEYSTHTGEDYANSGVARGGYYSRDYGTKSYYDALATKRLDYVSFRPLLYVK